MGVPLIFIVTTSLFQDWVICAPAAFRKSGSRLSRSLSGIEPLFSVTGYNHGSPLYYHRKLISQKFEWTIVASKSIRFVSIIMIHQLLMSIYLTNKYRAPLASDSLSHVLALFSHSYPRVRKVEKHTTPKCFFDFFTACHPPSISAETHPLPLIFCTLLVSDLDSPSSKRRVLNLSDCRAVYGESWPCFGIFVRVLLPHEFAFLAGFPSSLRFDAWSHVRSFTVCLIARPYHGSSRLCFCSELESCLATTVFGQFLLLPPRNAAARSGHCHEINQQINLCLVWHSRDSLGHWYSWGSTSFLRSETLTYESDRHVLILARVSSLIR